MPPKTLEEVAMAIPTKTLDYNYNDNDNDVETGGGATPKKHPQAQQPPPPQQQPPQQRQGKGPSSIFAARAGHTLEFEDIWLSTKTPKKANSPPPTKILGGISGSFPAKTLTAIMGPSGSGKTSLLKLLTGRIGGSSSSSSSSSLEKSGTVRLDDRPVDPSDISVRQQIAYVEQDVTIPSTCTPREAIRFSARLRLDRNLSDDAIEAVVDDILDKLRLGKCADTLIGGGPLMAGGLSGGEKKRVQCGVELVTNPEIVVLDEPTSGLDSYSAQSLVEILRKIADAGATVIVTIHQPPPPVVRAIDNLLLLLGGRLLYQGPMGEPLRKAFASNGFPKPEDYNIADWILQVAQTNTIEDLEAKGFFAGERANPKKNRQNAIQPPGNHASNSNKNKKNNKNHAGFVTQTRLLFDREIKKLVRDKFSFVVRIGSTTVFGLLFGMIFYAVGDASYFEYPEVMASFGAIANLLISTMFGVAESSLMEFPKDRPVFLREYSTNHYSVLPYFLAKFTLECFTVFLQVLTQLVAAFFLMGFQMNFFYFLGLNFMLALASTSIGIFIGSCVEDPNVAAELMPALIVPQLLFSGFFIQINLIPEFLRWAQYLCSLTYAIRLAALYEFGECETPVCRDLLENNGVYQLESYWYWVILVAIAVVCRVTSMVLLKGKASF